MQRRLPSSCFCVCSRRFHVRVQCLCSAASCGPKLQWWSKRCGASRHAGPAKFREILTLHLLFCTQVHSCKLLFDPMVVANAVRRYETCWLPLVAAHAATRARSVLAPPLDVAYIWLLHALDPINYAQVQPCCPKAWRRACCRLVVNRNYFKQGALLCNTSNCHCKKDNKEQTTQETAPARCGRQGSNAFCAAQSPACYQCTHVAVPESTWWCREIRRLVSSAMPVAYK